MCRQELIPLANENISWELKKEKSAELLARLLPLSAETLSSLDTPNSLYVVAYGGDELVPHLFDEAAQGIIYVGRCKADSVRHFTNGKTGESTLRRSLAAMLDHHLELNPIPRSNDETDIDRYDNYTLDSESEARLTQWIEANLSIAVLTLGSEEEREAMSLALIDYNCPIFNFQYNPGNRYGNQIKNYRSLMAEKAKVNDLGRISYK